MPAPASIEEVVSKMRDIPESLRSFLSSADVMDALRELQKTYMLSEQASIETSRTIAWYVLGFINAHELAQEISRIAPQGKLADFRSDIIKKIFMPFSVQLHAHGLNFETIVSATVPEAVAQIKPSVAAAPVTTEAKSAPPVITTPEIKPAPLPTVPPTAPTTPSPVIIEPPKPVAPPPVTEAPKPIISQVPTPTATPKPPTPSISGPSRVIFAPQTPSVAPAPAGEIKKEEGPAFQPIRYTPAPVIPEVPKVISVSKSSGAPTIPPPPPPVKPSPQTVSGPAIPVASASTKKETVIDLSTFEVKSATKPAPSLPQNPVTEPEPKAKGNILNLKP